MSTIFVIIGIDDRSFLKSNIQNINKYNVNQLPIKSQTFNTQAQNANEIYCR
jgi:hypothetical protein